MDNPDELQPSKIIEIINSEHDLTRCAHVLTAIDIHVAAKRLPECSNEEVHVVYEAIHSPKLKAMLQTDMGERVRKWLSEFGDALNPSATDEIANRDVLEYIKQGAGKIAETTQ